MADIPALVRLGSAFLRESPYGDLIPDDPAHLSALFARLIEHGDAALLVAQDDAGSVLGMIGLVIEPHVLSGARTCGELFWYVEAAARGTGAGLSLLDAAEAWAADNGADLLLMAAPNARVGALYERHGYAAVETMYGKRVIRES